MSNDIDDIEAALARAYGADVAPRGNAARRKAAERRPVSSLDGRRAKFTGRTVQFNVKMRPDLKDRIMRASREHDIPMTAMAEQAFEMLLGKLSGGTHA